MVGTVPQDYDFVVTDRDPILNFFDYATLDGDAVKVELNGKILNSRIDLRGESNPVPVATDLITGKNTLKITALNVGTRTNNTVGVAFPTGTVIYDKDSSGNYKSSSSGRFFYDLPRAGSSFELDFGLPLIRIDDRYPEAAQHVIDTEKKPQIRTIDRTNRTNRQKANTGRYSNLNGDRGPAAFGFEIDEAPPALFLENGTVGNTTRPIPQLDNGGAGGSLGQQTNNYGPQNIRLPDNSNVDFFAIGVPNPRRVNGTEGDDLNLTGRFGENNFIYGLAGNDTLSAAPTAENSGNNTLFGGPGVDTVYGGSGEDQLLGQNDKDSLYGGDGRDSLYGGRGNDDLTGGDGADTYWFAPGEGTDYVYGYNYSGGDRITFNSGLGETYNPSSGQISTRNYRSSLTTLLDFGTELLYKDQVMARFPLTSPVDVERGITIFT
jgi:Ca2+-binding RTX toxin-like protein